MKILINTPWNRKVIKNEKSKKRFQSSGIKETGQVIVMWLLGTEKNKTKQKNIRWKQH